MTAFKVYDILRATTFGVFPIYMCGAESVSVKLSNIEIPYDVSSMTLPVKSSFTTFFYTVSNSLPDSEFEGYGDPSTVSFYSNAYSS